MDPRAAALVEALGLEPHPEGGYFREVFRSSLRVDPADGRGPRTALTVIYFLLVAGQFSRWHRVVSDEAWQVSEGGPLELIVLGANGSSVERIVLEPLGDRRPLHVVPAGRWQAARPLGSYVLATCTVGPGFEFHDFEFLADQPLELARLQAIAPDLTRLA